MDQKCTLHRFGLRRFALKNSVALYRSRELDTIDLAGIDDLRRLGITDIYDLRKQAERNISPLLESGPINIHLLSDDLQDDENRTHLTRTSNIIEAYGPPGERMKHMYAAMARHDEALRSVINAALSSPTPVLIHCANGKDRAGVVCACVQRVLGDSREAVFSDYLETNSINEEMNHRDLQQLAHKMGDQELAVMAAMFAARTEYLDAFWRSLDTLYGSFQAFMNPDYRSACDALATESKIIL